MAAKIFNLPEGFEVPSFQYGNGLTIQDHWAKEAEFLERLKTWCLNRGHTNQKYIGEVITFPVADGKAFYMVATYSPLQLIHIPFGDAWDFQYVDRLTKKDIADKIEGQNKLNKLFGGTGK